MKFLINKALNLTLIFLIVVSTLGSFPGIVSASSPSPPMPDLTIVGAVSFSPTSPTHGQSIEVTFMVRN